MIERNVLRKMCRRTQEEAIIAQLAVTKDLTLDKAMDVYYHSRLSREISEGAYGLDNLSAAYLVDDLIENEPELFA